MKDKNTELEFMNKRYETFKKYVSTLTRLQVLTSIKDVLIEIAEYSYRDEKQELTYMKLILKEIDNELTSEEYNRVVDEFEISASHIENVMDDMECGSVDENEFKKSILKDLDAELSIYLPNEGEYDE